MAVILVLLITLSGCSVIRQSMIEDITEDETDEVDMYPAVPDELEGSYFLYGKNMGRNISLTGKVHVLSVLIEDGESKWDDEAIDSLSDTMHDVLDSLAESAEEYSADLSMTASYVMITCEKPLLWDEDSSWRDSAVKSAGYESMDKANALLCEEFDCDESVVLFCFNKSGRSFAEAAAEKDSVEYAVIYEHDVETYMHEMLHLFGTMDYYYPEEIKKISEKYFSGTIMASGTEPIVDSLSAFVIGWTDELSEDALAFLEETAEYTVKDAEDAGEEETFTGKVKDRPIRGYVDGKVEVIGLYTGDMVDGSANGKGSISYYNGDYCEGSFSYGILNGEGEYVWADGSRRSGEWVNGVLEGYGVDERAGGEKYVGEFKDGKYHGEGTYVDSKGNKYSGGWANGKFNGNGTYTWNNGGVYVGEFTDGSLTGYGVYTNAQGDEFEGYFENWEYVG